MDRARTETATALSPPPLPTSFPPHFWETSALVELIRIEFLQTAWQQIVLPAPPDAAQTALEVKDLLLLKQNERAAHLQDIEAQALSSLDYYQRMLMFSERSHPRTFLLLHACIAIGRTVVMHFKAKFQRPRPAQLEARLLPPIPTPGHPAYPSGHAFQQHLQMRVLRDLVPAQWAALEAFAWDVAVNRERAGLHYRSDTAAGQRLAAEVWPLLLLCSSFRKALDEARHEW